MTRRALGILAVALALASPATASGQHMRRIEPVRKTPHSLASPALPGGALLQEERGSRLAYVMIGAGMGAGIGVLSAERGGTYDFPAAYMLVCAVLGAGVGYIVSLVFVE